MVTAMSEVDDFLDATRGRVHTADLALQNGDATKRTATWSHDDPVTLFGAVETDHGWEGVSRVFAELAAKFSDCTSFTFELIAAGASGDLAYTVGYEHSSVSVDGEPRSTSLRVTQVYRREDGEWKVVHRHGDWLGGQHW
jgi:ketosteroid isomerase-like protein